MKPIHFFWILVGCVLLTVAGCSFTVVGAGEVGVQRLFGRVFDETLQPGLHFVGPFVSVEKMDIRTQEYTMSSLTKEGEKEGDDSMQALTSDGLSVTLDLTVWFNLKPETAVELYKTIGIEYADKIVRPACRAGIRDAAVKFKSEDIYSQKREGFVELVNKQIVELVGERGITIQRILVRNISLPSRVAIAIEAKMQAQQEAQQMQYVIQREQQEAERKRIEAEGLAVAQKIINDTLSDKYLVYYYTQTLKELVNSQNTTFVVLPFDQKLIPLMQMPVK